MKYSTTKKFDRAFWKFPKEIKKLFRKQVELLLGDIRHPSLRAKKYDEILGVWQARVTNNVRFYFCIVGNTYILLDIQKHKD